MLKKNKKELLILIFLLATIIPTLTLLFKTQIFKKMAAEGPLTITFNSSSGKPIKRIWPFFAQGGEEKEPMLSPAQDKIKKLQPELIRIDHLFDYGEIVKTDPSGKLVFDFEPLDKRVEEIISLGATPFLSLSYFPPAISSSPTGFPQSLADWQSLIQKTVQRYSGKSEKNISGIYYEVWNEPDLFGEMSSQVYFNLYKSTVIASSNCQNCNGFKIGGPALTTLKKDWLEEFLRMINDGNTRLDFISWHSYQIDPEKSLSEVQSLESSANYKSLKQRPELIISEAGSVPENSPLHDSYFDASQTVAAVSVLKDSLDKYVSFELKDGPDPQGKKYWGRWGLLTHQATGVTEKPRYYSFIYLNKLLDFNLSLSEITPGAYAIGSTDGKENYTIVASRPNGANPQPLAVSISQLPPGIYSNNVYSLNPLNQPLEVKSNQVSFNGGLFKLDLISPPNSTFLVELSRLSPALIKTAGKTNQSSDSAAKLTSFVPPLIFNLPIPANEINNLTVSFSFKPTWIEEDHLTHALFETKDNAGNGLSLWIGPSGSGHSLFLKTIAASQTKDQTEISLNNFKTIDWHELSLVLDNQKGVLGTKIDDQQVSIGITAGDHLKIGNFLFLGADTASQNSAEGAIDNLTINVNGQNLYQKDFN